MKISAIKYNNKLITDPTSIAKTFNDFFVDDIITNDVTNKFNTLTYSKYNSFFKIHQTPMKFVKL